MNNVKRNDNGPMLNAYPDSLGGNLGGIVNFQAFLIQIWTEDFQ